MTANVVSRLRARHEEDVQTHKGDAYGSSSRCQQSKKHPESDIAVTLKYLTKFDRSGPAGADSWHVGKP